MKFNLKKYQIFKLKIYLKEKDFLIFHCAKLNLKQWIIIEQQLKKLNLKYYKPLNGISLKILNTSTHKYFSHLINGPVLFIEYDSKVLETDSLSDSTGIYPNALYDSKPSLSCIALCFIASKALSTS